MPFTIPTPSNRWVTKLAYPSLATRLIGTPVTTLGQTKYTYAADPVITDVPCRKAPFVEERPQASERLASGAVTNIEEYVVAFTQYYPQFKQTDRVVIDGEEFGITAREPDGSKTYTRLRVISGKRP